MVGPETPTPREEPPEPNPFTPEEFAAWRGMLRVHSAVFRELDRQLLAEHGFGVDAYGVMVTLVGAPARRVPIGELGLRRNLSPSGISRSVDRLTKLGLVERATNPDDGRSLLVGLTANGLRALREAQVSHHRIVREMLLARLDRRDLKRIGELWEKAMPGAVSSPTWPL
jgi:DNA-binding MarR family transcriptional regulator